MHIQPMHTHPLPSAVRTALLFGAIALSACVADNDEVGTFGAPETDLSAYEPRQSLNADPTWDCHMETWYIDNNANPTSVPWAYCVCGVNGPAPDGSWELGGGYWTMPWPDCGYQYPL